jgi:hypothetical protein
MAVVLIEHTNSPESAAFSLQSLEDLISGTRSVIFQHIDCLFFASMETSEIVTTERARNPGCSAPARTGATATVASPRISRTRRVSSCPASTKLVRPGVIVAEHPRRGGRATDGADAEQAIAAVCRGLA